VARNGEAIDIRQRGRTMIMKQAVGVIHDEHRSLAAVIHGLEFVSRNSSELPDFRLLNAMLYYIREYPERVHHPTEDTVLFALIQERTSEADPVIAELEAEHAQGEALLGELTAALNRLQAGAPNAAARFALAVRRFADFYWAHMRKEEDLLLPIAMRVLTDDDWANIHAAFAAHSDPMYGGDAADEFNQLFSRIVLLAPPPIGLGGASR
jgi:hemerythrin-like domain-containing protein